MEKRVGNKFVYRVRKHLKAGMPKDWSKFSYILITSTEIISMKGKSSGAKTGILLIKSYTSLSLLFTLTKKGFNKQSTKLAKPEQGLFGPPNINLKGRSEGLVKNNYDPLWLATLLLIILDLCIFGKA